MGPLLFRPLSFLDLLTLQLWITQALRHSNAAPGPATVNDATVSGMRVCTTVVLGRLEKESCKQGLPARLLRNHSTNPSSGTSAEHRYPKRFEFQNDKSSEKRTTQDVPERFQTFICSVKVLFGTFNKMSTAHSSTSSRNHINELLLACPRQ